MATYPTAIHLCSGYGGFELALRPWGVRTVAHVERDSYAASILMERMEQKRLDQAPIWDDLTTFDGEPWRRRVDLITAGFPCQPFSAAGARRGLDDDRWLWPSIARIITEIRPRFVVLENVPPVVRAGLPAVLADLAQLGFDAEWGLYSAADIGAPHRRQRWWCVAYAGSERLSRVSGIPHGAESENKRRINANADHIVKRNVEAVADTGSARREWEWPVATRSQLNDACRSSTDNVADTESVGSLPGQRPATRDRWTVAEAGHRFPPTRDDAAAWSRWISEGGPQPVVRRLADGPPAGLADALHLGGNGLVPQTATAAIQQLLERGGWQL